MSIICQRYHFYCALYNYLQGKIKGKKYGVLHFSFEIFHFSFFFFYLLSSPKLIISSFLSFLFFFSRAKHIIMALPKFCGYQKGSVGENCLPSYIYRAPFTLPTTHVHFSFAKEEHPTVEIPLFGCLF